MSCPANLANVVYYFFSPSYFASIFQILPPRLLMIEQYSGIGWGGLTVILAPSISFHTSDDIDIKWIETPNFLANSTCGRQNAREQKGAAKYIRLLIPCRDHNRVPRTRQGIRVRSKSE
jgi:hypothetical protein